MRSSIMLILAFLLLGCNSNRKFFNSGTVTTSQKNNYIEIFLINNLPFCEVEIGDKKYKFLIDTGAPTMISEEVYNKLSLPIVKLGKVRDSQKIIKKEKFTSLPYLKIGDYTFNEIACIVTDFKKSEMKCFDFDGIIGANLLAKTHCEFDYSNNKITMSENLNSFALNSYDFAFAFKPKRQKTPIIQTEILDKSYSMIFDTGYNDNIQIVYNKNGNARLNLKHISFTGSNSLGLYGRSEAQKTMIFKGNIRVNKHEFINEIIATGNSNLVGNAFLKDYLFLMDWKNNKIYFKKLQNLPVKEIRGFGFAYVFEKGKMIVISKIDNFEIPLNIGDQILSINEIPFTNLNENIICDYLINSPVKKQKEIKISIKRDEEILTFELKRMTFLN
jgi:predicted aspartyl protease